MPTLSIELPTDTFARLQRWAAARNQTVAEAVTPVIEGLAPPPPPSDERRQAFDALTALIQSRAHLDPPGFQVESSRESIYEGDGE